MDFVLKLVIGLGFSLVILASKFGILNYLKLKKIDRNIEHQYSDLLE